MGEVFAVVVKDEDKKLLGAWPDRYVAEFEALRYEEEHKKDCEIVTTKLEFPDTIPCCCYFAENKGHKHSWRCGNTPTKKYEFSWGSEVILCDECAELLKRSDP